jgi:hypothetical protein
VRGCGVRRFPARPLALAAVRKLGFQGFLYWIYDCDEQPELWNAKAGKGEIMEVLRQAAKAGQW